MLQFICEHCGETREYNQQTLRNFQRDTVDVKGHVVCKDCGEKYKDINRQVQEFADMKREELESEFFNTSNDVSHETQEEDFDLELEEALEEEIEKEIKGSKK